MNRGTPRRKRTVTLDVSGENTRQARVLEAHGLGKDLLVMVLPSLPQVLIRTRVYGNSYLSSCPS